MNMSAIRWEERADHIVILTLDDPQQSANTMNALFQSSLVEVTQRLLSVKEQIRGVVITSAKKTFFAGGDLRLLIQAQPEQAEQITHEIQLLKKQLRQLETLGIPVVAAMNGTALGGGLEIALACHHRIAVRESRSEYGLPEVTLGLLPGGGGVVRVVRMLGIQNALMNVLLQGPRMKADKALEVGLLDALVDDIKDLLPAAIAWIEAHPKSRQPWDVQGYRMPGGTPSTPALAMNLPAFPANLRKQLKGAHLHYPAPAAIMAAAVEGAQVELDQAFAIETRYFVHLATGKISKNMIQAFFFDLQSIQAGGSRPDVQQYPRQVLKKIGVLGAGMMGQGIAYACASAGLAVVLLDQKMEWAERGKDYSAKLLQKKVSKGRMSQDKADALLARIEPATAMERLADCELVIEAVFEDRDIKAAITGRAGEVLKPEAVMASNTSTLPIAGLAKAYPRMEQFIGLHFFSPVDKMQLVEIICAKETSPQTLATAIDFVLHIRKIPIVVNDSRGFFTSRVFATYCYEGIAMLAEGFPAASIEQAAAQAGMPVGPLAVMDEVNLELTRKVRRQTAKDLAEQCLTMPVHPAEAVIDRMCDEFGRPGKKEKAGFYDYPEGTKKTLWPGLAEHFALPELAQPTAQQFSLLQDRLLFRQSIEALRCYEEGVVRSIADANIGSVFGIGMAPWTGGVLQFVDYVGIDAFIDRCRELESLYGERFAPPEILFKRRTEGDRFRNC